MGKAEKGYEGEGVGWRHRSCCDSLLLLLSEEQSGPWAVFCERIVFQGNKGGLADKDRA